MNKYIITEKQKLELKQIFLDGYESFLKILQSSYASMDATNNLEKEIFNLKKEIKEIREKLK